jgi:hypothetical protein
MNFNIWHPQGRSTGVGPGPGAIAAAWLVARTVPARPSGAASERATQHRAVGPVHPRTGPPVGGAPLPRAATPAALCPWSPSAASAAPTIPSAGRRSDRAVETPSTDHLSQRLPRRTRSSEPSASFLAPTGSAATRASWAASRSNASGAGPSWASTRSASRRNSWANRSGSSLSRASRPPNELGPLLGSGVHRADRAALDPRWGRCGWSWSPDARRSWLQSPVGSAGRAWSERPPEGGNDAGVVCRPLLGCLGEQLAPGGGKPPTGSTGAWIGSRNADASPAERPAASALPTDARTSPPPLS